ncbi:MAG: hypothetical protein HYY93_09050 [Planctomycetes bacterium]|nr:hypothetical protein [Planctomycetota bacterium]
MALFAPAAASLWRDRLARLAALLLHPICIREFRGMFRSLRFFWTYFALLGGMGFAIILVMLTVSVGEVANPGDIGFRVFAIFCLLQAIGLGLVVPAIGCTGLVAERERHTFDLLITSTLTPGEIVWGKFSATLGYSALLLASALPLVSLSFLFGGVSPAMLLGSYAVLFLLAAFLSALGIFVSSVSKTYARAIITGYILTIVLGGFICAVFERPLERMLDYALLGRSHRPWTWWRLGGSFEEWMGRVVLPAYLYVAGVAFFMIAAANRLKPPVANKTTNMKLFYALFMAAGLTGWGVYLSESRIAGTLSASMHRQIVLVCLMMVAVLALLSTAFACESPEIPLRIQRRMAAWRGWRAWLRAWGPGNMAGVRFAVYTNAALLLGTLLFVQQAEFGGRGWFSDAFTFGSGDWLVLPATVAVILALVYAAAAHGAFWATVFRKPAYPYIVQLGVALIALSASPIWRGIWYAAKPWEERRFGRLFVLDVTNFPVTIASIWDGLQNGVQADVPYAWTVNPDGGGLFFDERSGEPVLPLWIAFVTLHVAVGILFSVWASHRMHRRAAAVALLQGAPPASPSTGP